MSRIGYKLAEIIFIETGSCDMCPKEDVLYACISTLGSDTIHICKSCCNNIIEKLK